MTNKEAIERLEYIKTHHTDPEDYELFDLAIKALEERPQSDLINREDLKKEFALLMWREHNPYDAIKVCDIVNQTLDFIDNAPTVEAVEFDCHSKLIKQAYQKGKGIRPKGEWGKWVVAEVQCPNCFKYFEVDCYSTEELNKCPNCGAKMKGEE